MIIKHISHTDLDGEGCILFAKYYYSLLGKDYNYECVRTRAETQEVDKVIDEQLSSVLPIINNEQVLLLITDLSCSEAKAEILTNMMTRNHNLRVLLIDHHKTAEYLNKYFWGVVSELIDDNKPTSGCELLYNYYKINYYVSTVFNNLTLNKFVQLVNDYDSWLWSKNDDQEPVRLNYLLTLLGNNKFHEEVYNRLLEGQFDLDNKGDNPIPDKYMEILEVLEHNKEKYILNKLTHMKVYKDSENRTVGLIEAENYVSEIGELGRKQYPAIDYFAIKYPGGVSLKSGINRSVDLAKVASDHGGGGHYDSSGFSIDNNRYYDYLKELINL